MTYKEQKNMNMNIMNNDIDECYKMEGTVNEVDKLVSEKIEILGPNKEILSWTLDAKPKEELSSRQIIYKYRTILTVQDAVAELLSNEVNMLQAFNVSVEHKRKDHIRHIFTRANSIEVEYDNFYAHFKVPHNGYGPDRCDRWCLEGAVFRDPNYPQSHAHSMKEVIDYINHQLFRIDKAEKILSSIDYSYEEYHFRQSILEKMHSYESELGEFTQHDFDPSCVYSVRIGRKERKDRSYSIIEARLQEKAESRGYVAFFTEYVTKKSGQVYSRELPMLLVNEVDGIKGPGGLVRLLWRDKGKTIIGRNPNVIHKEYTAHNYVMEFLNSIYKPEQVLPIMKYMYHTYAPMSQVQLHGVTQSQLYWIGKETSVKKIMAKAYGKSGVDGLTKHAFGGFNNLDTINKLMDAICVVRSFKFMKPQFFESISHDDITEYIISGKDSVGQMQKYIKYFYTSAFEKELTEDWRGYKTQDIALTLNYFRRIKSTKMRTAIRNHVKRSNFTVEQTLHFVSEEMNKLVDKDLKIPTGKYGKYHGTKIGKDIKVIMPKTVEDLVQWGATQNNCIGSYGASVHYGERSIFGFKDNSNEWIGHLEINSKGKLIQLLGKHNGPINLEHYRKIVKWLKSIDVNTSGEFWGKQ